MSIGEARAYTEGLYERGGTFVISPLSTVAFDKASEIFTMIHRQQVTTTQDRSKVTRFMQERDGQDWLIYYKMTSDKASH